MRIKIIIIIIIIIYIYIHRTPTMVNTLSMKFIPFASVSNEMLDKIISQNKYCDINSFPSSYNDILTDIDPDINNLIPNGLKISEGL